MKEKFLRLGIHMMSYGRGVRLFVQADRFHIPEKFWRSKVLKQKLRQIFKIVDMGAFFGGPLL